MEGHKEDAKKLLDRFRADSEHPYYSDIHTLAFIGHFSLADIGTSEEELEQLQRNGLMSAAKKSLDHIRAGGCGHLYDWIIPDILKQSLSGNFSLADIGTSEKELEQLRRKRLMAAGKKWLDHLRAGGECLSDWSVADILKLALSGNFSLADIGTSEEELEQLRRKGCRRVQD